MTTAKIIYTHTDEAPALATYSLLPIIQAFTRAAASSVETARHLARRPHPRHLPRRAAAGPAAARRPGRARRAGHDARRPTSSSCRTSAPRSRSCKAAIKELQEQGYPVPDYPDDPKTDDERGDIKARYAKVLGQRRQPGAARRQLRPPRRRVGEAVRHEAPALDGRVERATRRRTSRT